MKTWKYSDSELRDAITKLTSSIPDNENYCVEYLAGYNKKGTKVYIDKHVPEQYIRHLKVHEIIEKVLEETLHLDYFSAHQIALRVEKASVEADGETWENYDKAMQKLINSADHEKITNSPPDLDLTPYEAEHDLKGIRRLTKMQ
jgi:hypothetical protein